MKNYEKMKTEIQKDLTDLENRIAQMTNVLTDYVQMTVAHLQPLFDAVEKATALIEAKNGTQDATKCAEGMTNEEAASYFKEIIECADLVDASYTDGVKVEAIRTAFKALRHREAVCCNPKEYAQDATEAAEMHDFREGELIVYVNGETFQIGEIKRLCNDGAFVYYHEGDTASKTPFENMHKLQNAYCIKQTSLALYRPRCESCKHFSICSAKTDIEATTDASKCNDYTEE